jgi:hypothetical protein
MRPVLFYMPYFETWHVPVTLYLYVVFLTEYGSTLCYVMLCYVMLCYVMLCYVMLYILCYIVDTGARGSIVVKALCYKQEDRGFETRGDE